MVRFLSVTFFGDSWTLDIWDEMEDDEVDRDLVGVDPWERGFGAITALERRYES